MICGALYSLLASATRSTTLGLTVQQVFNPHHYLLMQPILKSVSMIILWETVSQGLLKLRKTMSTAPRVGDFITEAYRVGQTLFLFGEFMLTIEKGLGSYIGCVVLLKLLYRLKFVNIFCKIKYLVICLWV